MASSLRRGFLGIRKTLNSISMANHTSIAVSPLRSETRYRSHLDSITRFSLDAHSFEIDLSNEESKRRTLNKLLYRSKQRGFLELDLVLGKWVEENISTMDETGIKSLVDVLDLENPDLWKWLTSQEQVPEELKSNAVFCGVREKVMRNLNSHASPETLATPGKPWVRGWDDLKRGRDSPISELVDYQLQLPELCFGIANDYLNISKQLIPLKSVKLLDSLYEAENRIKKSGRGVSSDTPYLC